VFSWINLDLDGVGRSSGDMSYANGLLYKLHCDRNVYRAGVDVFRYTYQFGAMPDPDDAHYPWYTYGEGKYTTIEARLGYERRLGSRKLQPFVGADIAFRYARNDGFYEGLGDIGPPYEFFGETRTTSQQFLVSPLVGLNYQLAEHFSISVEGSCSFGSGRTTEEVSGRAGKREGLGFANPVRTLSINYHF
jgi:hypothetical protein